MTSGGPLLPQATDFSKLADEFFTLKLQHERVLDIKKVETFLSFLTVDNMHQVPWNKAMVEGVLVTKKVNASIFAWLVYCAVSQSHESSQIILKRISKDIPAEIKWDDLAPNHASASMVEAIWLIANCATNNQTWAKEILLNVATHYKEGFQWTLTPKGLNHDTSLIQLVKNAAVDSSPSKDWANKILALIVPKPAVEPNAPLYMPSQSSSSSLSVQSPQPQSGSGNGENISPSSEKKEGRCFACSLF